MKAAIMTFGRRAMLVLQPETDAERVTVERIRSMKRDGRIESVHDAWAGAPMFALELEDLDPRYER